MSLSSETTDTEVRHVLALSGGKDSTALAIYLRDRVPQMEYAFCDTGEELPETYEYLDKLEAYLGKPIARLNPDRPFSHYLELWNNNLPDARTRWCTRVLKLKPFEDFVGDDPVISYVGIRADENRSGYVSTKPNIQARFPFKEDGITKEDVMRILEDCGLGLPEYYKWRSRSGCYFCFFQQRNEWVGLKENHPDLFEKAKQFEKEDAGDGKSYTWNQRESLVQLEAPERTEQIKRDHAERLAKSNATRKNLTLVDVLVDDEEEAGCLICHL